MPRKRLRIRRGSGLLEEEEEEEEEERFISNNNYIFTQII